MRSTLLFIYFYFFGSHTVTTSLQVAVHFVNVTNLDQVHFSVTSRVSASVITTPLARSVTYVSGDSLDFLVPHVKVKYTFFLN